MTRRCKSADGHRKRVFTDIHQANRRMRIMRLFDHGIEVYACEDHWHVGHTNPAWRTPTGLAP